jgi:cytochrome P450
VIAHIPAQCPVFRARMEAFSAGPIDVAVLGGYNAIMATARLADVMSSAPQPEMADQARAGVAMMNLPTNADPPLAFDYRAVIDPFVSPDAVTELEPRVRRLAGQLADRFIERGSADAVQELAQPLTAMLTMWLTGLPEEKWRRYSDCIHRLLWRDGDLPALAAEIGGVQAELREDIRRLRADPSSTGVIGASRDARVDGRPIEPWEVEGLIWLLLLGGVDTTQALVGGALVFLGRNDGHRRQLIGSPTLLPSAIEEFLRFHAPVLATPRVVAQDIKVEGVSLRKGERALLCWAAANRDPATFERPNEVVFNRPTNRHLTFSVGPHRCLGLHVARMEIRVILEEVLRRCSAFQLVERELVFAPDVGIIYGYKAVPLTFPSGTRESPPDARLERLLLGVLT